MIRKPGGKRRRLGIPTVRDRVVQAALKFVPEPIFEADFASCSYRFRLGRLAQDAIAEIHYLTGRLYEWLVARPSRPASMRSITGPFWAGGRPDRSQARPDTCGGVPARGHPQSALFAKG
jgi:hypothetical protein